MSDFEVWQEVDCPQHDYDLFDTSMVHAGQEFDCLACGGRHIASNGLIEMYERHDGVLLRVALPRTAEDMRTLGYWKHAE